MNADIEVKQESVFATLALIDEMIPGWTPLDQLQALFMLAYGSACRGGDIVEFGSWCGRSTVTLALAMAAAGVRGVVHAVDLFPAREDWKANEDGNYFLDVDFGDRHVRALEDQSVWPEPFKSEILPLYQGYDSIRARFDQSVRRFGVEERVRPFWGSSADFIRHYGDRISADFVFIDAEHSYSAVVKDIEGAERVLAPGGWICFDDAFTSYEGVTKAIREKIIDNSRYNRGCHISRKMYAARWLG